MRKPTLIIASLSLLGLVGLPCVAATTGSDTDGKTVARKVGGLVVAQDQPKGEQRGQKGQKGRMDQGIILQDPKKGSDSAMPKKGKQKGLYSQPDPLNPQPEPPGRTK
jgi:hypothetical protein